MSADIKIHSECYVNYNDLNICENNQRVWTVSYINHYIRLWLNVK